MQHCLMLSNYFCWCSLVLSLCHSNCCSLLARSSHWHSASSKLYSNPKFKSSHKMLFHIGCFAHLWASCKIGNSEPSFALLHVVNILNFFLAVLAVIHSFFWCFLFQTCNHWIFKSLPFSFLFVFCTLCLLSFSITSSVLERWVAKAACVLL